MTHNIKSTTFLFIALLMVFSSCKKEKYSFGQLKTPAGLVLTAVIAGANAANPTGDGSGSVAITATASDAITYKIDFGDGITKMVPSGTINYKYANPGTMDYTITINAIGTGGTTSTISKKIKVFVAFVIPADIVQFLTNGSSKVWVTDKNAPGHVGIGPADAFAPIWYAATPNQRDACLYDDEITFSKDAAGNISMAVDNKGQASLIGAATAYYGTAGGDGCYPVAAAGVQKLVFMNATSPSTAAISTRIQFVVPGKGIINFGTGGNTYEILTISATTVQLRNIGIDGNAWYQILKVK